MTLNTVDCVWNVMAHVQKPDFVFRRNGQVHLNLRGRQFSRLLAAKACASALVMLDTWHSKVVWEYWLPTPFASSPFTSPPMRHCEPTHFKRSLPTWNKMCPVLWLTEFNLVYDDDNYHSVLQVTGHWKYYLTTVCGNYTFKCKVLESKKYDRVNIIFTQ